MNRPFLMSLVMVVLVACTNTSDDFLQIRNILAPGPAGFDPRFVALAKTNPEAMQLAILKNNLSGTILLENRRAGIETWMTPDGASIITQQGMLRATRSFGEGLMASEIEQSLFLVLNGQAGRAERFHSYLTGDDEIVTRTYLCDIENRGARSVTIGGLAVSTRLMAEDCRSLDQSFLNLYWVSMSGNRIVQTRQWTGDYLGIVSTRVLPR